MKKRILFFSLLLTQLLTYGQVYKDLLPIGEIDILLPSSIKSTSGSMQLVSFGVPFPRNLVSTI